MPGDMTGGHVPTIINVWTKYGVHRLYGYGDRNIKT